MLQDISLFRLVFAIRVRVTRGFDSSRAKNHDARLAFHGLQQLLECLALEIV